MISVLFVDDEPVLVDVGRLFLQRSGDFSVTGCFSAEEAVNLLQKHSYDVIISDYQMPGMNGIDLLKIVRNEYGDIPFILFTGRGREDVAGEAVNMGVNFYVQKGGDPKLQFADIGHKIETAVERRRALLAIRESEQRFYDIINFLPDATFAINMEGDIIAWNREIERITGTKAEKMIGRRGYTHSVPFYGKRRPMIIDLLLHPDPDFERQYPSIQREDSTITAEGVLHLSDKDHVFLARASFLFEKAGKPAGAIESLRDITRQKASEEKLRRIITHLPVGVHIFRTDDQGQLICYKGNPASKNIFGSDRECEAGIPIEYLFSGTDKERICSVCHNIAREGGTKCFSEVQIISGNTTKTYDLTVFQTGPGEVAILFNPGERQ